MREVLAELHERGWVAEEAEPDGIGIAVPFEHGEVFGELPALVEVTELGVLLRLVAQVPNVSVERFLAVMPEDPADDQVHSEYDFDEAELTLAAIAAGETELDAAVIVEVLVPRALQALHDLLDAGAIDVTDAEDDEEVAEIRDSLQALKATDPRRAIERCLAAAERCCALGNPSLGSVFRLAAGEVLLELGDVHGAETLIEPAWAQLNEPTGLRELVAGVASLRIKQGRGEEGVALLQESLAEQDNPGTRAALRADLGVALAQCGREVEASQLLKAAADDPLLDNDLRPKVTRELEVLRSWGGAAPTPDDPGEGLADVLDAADARLNAIAALLATLDRSAYLASRDHLIRLIELVERDIDRLGPGQKARLAQARAYVAHMDGDPAAARGLITQALDWANESGDVTMTRMVQSAGAVIADPRQTADDPALPPLERMTALVNNAFGEMQAIGRLWFDDPVARAGLAGAKDLAGIDEEALRASGRRSQANALQAIELADTQRHRYTSVADRAAWASLAGRAYEIGLTASVAMQDHAEVIEILERTRAQGAPSGIADDDGESEAADDDDDGLGERQLLALLRESLGDRPVTRPLVATVRAGEGAHGAPVQRVDLDDIVAAVAGGPAWWWGCHAFGERLYWAVRSPDGRTWSWLDLLYGAPEPGFLEAAYPFATDALVREAADRFFPTGQAPIRLTDLPHLFRSKSRKDAEPHVLLGDEEGRRDEVLRALAKAVLPAPLAEALRDAARRGEPLRLVWAPPLELARMPLGLLPLDDDHVLLEGAVVVMAPPTSLVVADEVPSPQPAPAAPRPVLLVVGGDPNLGMLTDLIGRVAPTPTSVLGTARHVAAGTAGAVARPEAVLQAWRVNREAVAVYYGHIYHDEHASSGSAALSVTDGSRPAPLPVSQLLTPDREGAPSIMVLAGCASLSAADAGTGEWWGLATGLLWQGSSHVVGSAWTVRTQSPTEDFVAELTSELRVTDDPALALHRLQLDRYRQWRRTGDPLPYDWSGWSIVSTAAAR